MSTPAVIFSVYFFTGLLLAVVALATRSKEKRDKSIDISTGSSVDAGLLIFIAVLWPIWLLIAFLKS